MGILALSLGIIAIIISLVPICGAISIIPALFGILFGIIDLIVKTVKKIKKGIPITGIVLSFLSVCIVCTWLFIGYRAFEKGEIQNQLRKVGEEIQIEINEEKK